ncbi:aspartic proteinase CDR1-like [Tasmannia lanceolata]|uniref:aspartic proteinase CDR1-like n=1 Tax=Tasmannia lanceolata TaxID=3420 RepID=UPI004063FF9B
MAHVLAILLSLSLFVSLRNEFVEASNGGFSVDLIHRDSPLSPFFNSSDTFYDRVKKAVLRSNSRLERFRQASSSPSSVSPPSISSTVIPNSGEYLMTLSVGTPPVNVKAILDTGSDLIWVQCKPCDQCYPQNDPLFDPSNSTTYRNLSCQSTPCANLEASCGVTNECEYTYQYGDNSFTDGVLASETLTFDSTSGRSVQIPKVSFGCGHHDDGTFDGNGDGLVGLGGGPLSLVSQLGSSIDGKFSYCLVPLTETSATSVLNFGDHAVLSGKGVVSTPLISEEIDTFYGLTLEEITVGNTSVKFPVESGNIIIDSGTTLTILLTSVFEVLESAVKDSVNAQPIDDPNGIFSLCYGTDAEFPSMTYAFTGAELLLAPLNMFVEVAEGVVCFAVLPDDDFSIYGNLAQMNFKVGYDLVEKTVSFVPTDCTKN